MHIALQKLLSPTQYYLTKGLKISITYFKIHNMERWTYTGASRPPFLISLKCKWPKSFLAFHSLIELTAYFLDSFLEDNIFLLSGGRESLHGTNIAFLAHRSGQTGPCCWLIIPYYQREKGKFGQ